MAGQDPISRGQDGGWAIREELERVDLRLVDLLADRLELVQRLWSYKRAHALPLVDPSQEEKVVARAVLAAGRRGMEPRFAERLFRELIREGKRAAELRPMTVPPPGLRGRVGTLPKKRP
ncbi:MAG TPA: chorismate mutase [Thermoplasmata archaeon]|nr:chorismate mutase [Thermoplasmata archaeon]